VPSGGGPDRDLGSNKEDTAVGYRIVFDEIIGPSEMVYPTFEEAVEAVNSALGFEVIFGGAGWPDEGRVYRSRAYQDPDAGETIVEGDLRFEWTTWFNRGANFIDVIEEAEGGSENA
jgi:hypothetical protein